MSTYNGEKYLEEQLESLIQQEGVDISIFVRDDGSTDKTHSILNKWQSKGLLSWYTGVNLGAAKSFFDLIKCAPKSDFYAFCDQDDVWLPNKLYKAMGYMSQIDNSSPQLYCCGFQVVDASLNLIREETRPYYKLDTAGSVMLDSFATGCTMVFNHALIGELKAYTPKCFVYHDRWAFLVAYFLGGVYFDHFANLKYRQHDSNVIGCHKDLTKRERLKKIINPQIHKLWSPLWVISNELLDQYGFRLSPENKDVLSICSSYNRSFKSLCQLLFSRRFKISKRGIKSLLYRKYRILRKEI